MEFNRNGTTEKSDNYAALKQVSLMINAPSLTNLDHGGSLPC
jgi:hypothetical protein